MLKLHSVRTLCQGQSEEGAQYQCHPRPLPHDAKLMCISLSGSIHRKPEKVVFLKFSEWLDRKITQVTFKLCLMTVAHFSENRVLKDRHCASAVQSSPFLLAIGQKTSEPLLKKKDNWRREQSGMPDWYCCLFIRAGMLCVIFSHAYSRELCKVSWFYSACPNCFHLGDISYWLDNKYFSIITIIILV